LGEGSRAAKGMPVRSLPGSNWIMGATGAATSLALKKDGTLWGWGDNWAGNLGVPNVTYNLYNHEFQGSKDPVQVGSNRNWIKIWAGGLQSVGQQSDGSLWFWGSLSGNKTNRFFVPTRVSSDTNWVDVTFGEGTVLAIKSDGTLWACGREVAAYTGQVSTNLIPIQVGTDTNWSACAHLPEASCHVLQKRDGSLWTMNLEYREYKPIKLHFERINFNQDYVAFSGGYTGVALKDNGEVWTWGRVIGDHELKDYYRDGNWTIPKLTIKTNPWPLSIVYPDDLAYLRPKNN
jgi:trimeric autotransporter adhesin